MKGFCDFLESHVKVRIEEEDEVRCTSTGWVFSPTHNYQEVHIKKSCHEFHLLSHSLWRWL